MCIFFQYIISFFFKNGHPSISAALLAGTCLAGTCLALGEPEETPLKTNSAVHPTRHWGSEKKGVGPKFWGGPKLTEGGGVDRRAVRVKSERRDRSRYATDAWRVEVAAVAALRVGGRVCERVCGSFRGGFQIEVHLGQIEVEKRLFCTTKED